MKRIIIYFSLVFFIALTACKTDATTDKKLPEEKEIKEFIQIKNKENVGVEDQQIDDYLSRRNWVFEKTKTGIRYQFYRNGSGLQPQAEQVVELEYALQLIRGEEIYNSRKDGLLTFTIDKDDVPAGLNEFVKMMHVGDKAKLIVPSYLGFGATGDDNKIPPRATLIYDLELKQVKL